VLRDVTLSVAPRETISIVGRSGAGKSVTLKLIIALIKPDAGHIWIDGEDITRIEGKEPSRVRR
jgi:ABC-type sugar transport system ATPase subunit